MTKFDAHEALGVLNSLADEFALDRLDKPDRTKAQKFRTRSTGRELAILVGEWDRDARRFTRGDCRLLLEEYPPPEIGGVIVVPSSNTYKGHLSREPGTRLTEQAQRSVMVQSPDALRSVIAWYSGVQTPTHTSTNAKMAQPATQTAHVTSARNLILYGPPGTGKTYQTAFRAVALCDGVEIQDRESLMKRFNQLLTEGRISFVTFHQSYGYEDFVEGLRPEAKDGQITYRVRQGVFRDVCDAARRSASVKPGLGGKPLQKRNIFKMSLGVANSTEGKKVLQESFSLERVFLGWGGESDFTGCNTAAEVQARFKEDYPDDTRVEANTRFVNVLKNEMQVGDIVVASQGNAFFKAIGEITGEYELFEGATFHQARKVRWLAVFEENRPVNEIYDRGFTQQTLYRLDNSALKYSALEGLLRREQAALPFVLVVDEINRANISKVFGELITLLEADKREGELNGLSVRLPYSGDLFSVPRNLHVLGTMNTADRSIALLDTALRRRFEFEEIRPKPALLSSVIDGVNLEAMLTAINSRIECLYDRDHEIGHAYFWGVTSFSELEDVFRHRVIPLLQEYFHEDWAKIRTVLNDSAGGFIEARERPKLLQLSDFEDEVRPLYNVKRESFGIDAFKKIYEA
jgi:5-methylcytosine-specific restriction protein B